MLRLIQEYRLDAIAFAVLLTVSAIIAHIWLRQRHGRGMPPLAWGILTSLLIAGFVAPEIFGEQQRRELREMISGIAPTYAQELELAGHDRITLETPPDDPLYLSLVAAEIRWEKVNDKVTDIYTMRRKPDGNLVLVVSSEVDYDRNGIYEGDREARTEIGEVYDDVSDEMIKALAGETTFDDVPKTDRWGTTVSAFVPMRNPAGAIDAILGVDYDANSWLMAIVESRGAALGAVAVLSVILLASTLVVVMTRAELRRREIAEIERAKLNQQLVIASRQAGMAEIATNVLHNVGNVLNSVNVSAGMVIEGLHNSKLPALAAAMGMVRDHRTDLAAYLTSDGRGKVLPEYLLTLSATLTIEHQATETEMGELARSIDHIKQIVASQQDFARCTEEDETFELNELFEEALRINDLAESGTGFEIDRQLADVGPVTANRHKVLQILVNLISNAKNAVKANTGFRNIELRTETAKSEDGRPIVRLIVKDNGMGIEQASLGQLFNHGFTTRKDGHGFGLHSSALAAQQMKGRISAASDGPNLGACFTVEIPTTLLTTETAL